MKSLRKLGALPSSLSLIRSNAWRAALGSLLLAAALLALPAASSAQTLYYLTRDGKLTSASSTIPGTFATPVAITGVTSGETLVGIDVRPQNQQLYALGVNPDLDTATLYHLAPETGVASVVGGMPGSITFTFDGASGIDFEDPVDVVWNIDFNPAADRLRVVVAGGLDFRVNPNTGGPVDGDLGGAAGSQAGVNPDGFLNGITGHVQGAAYTNNGPNNGGITTLYTVATGTNALYIQKPPNTGTQTSAVPLTLGGAPLVLEAVRGFDIEPRVNAPAGNSPVGSGSGLLVATEGGSTKLYRVNLVTGVVTSLGAVPLAVRSTAVCPDLGAAITLNATTGEFVRFDPNTPGTVTTQSINGKDAGETIVAIAARPQTGQLYGLGVNSTQGVETATLYLLDPQTGAATAVGTTGQIAFTTNGSVKVDLPDPSVGYGLDFNPTVDRLRVVTGSGLNFRVNPNTGAPVDGDNGGAAGAVAGINTDGALNGGSSAGHATAYTNSFGQSLIGGVTTEYTFNATTSTLFIQSPSNAGVLGSPLSLNLGALGGRAGFAIPAPVAVANSGAVATGFGYLQGSSGSGVTLFQVNLATGDRTFLGNIGSLTSAAGLVVWATAPQLAVWRFSQINSQVTSGATSSFADGFAGVTATNTFTLQNLGSQPLTVSGTLATGTAYDFPSGSSVTVPGFDQATFSVRHTPQATGSENDTLTFTTNDPSQPTFTLALTAGGAAPLAADTAISSEGETRIDVLVNDNLFGQGLTIVSVSDPLIRIEGRTLVAPAGFTGTFTYTVQGDASATGIGTVTVTAAAPVLSPTAFSGLIADAQGVLVGYASASLSAKGLATVALRGGAVPVSAKVSLPTAGATGSVFTKLGYLTLTRNANGSVSLSLASMGGTFTGTLRPTVKTATARKLNLILAPVDIAITGGGYGTASITATGAVTVAGTLPDGTTFSAGTRLSDNSTFAFFATAKGPKPPAIVGGELTLSDLVATDLTGDLIWQKLPQPATAKGFLLGGVNTYLATTGSVYPGTLTFAGAGTLTLSGGNLAATETNAVMVTTGVPAVPTGSLKTWKVTTAKTGRFTLTVAVPGIVRSVTGKGVYLPKSGLAFGFFPGKTLGGRVVLSLP